MKTIHYPIDGDRRYTVTREGGYMFALYFAGELVSTHLSYMGAALRAVGHRAIANGAAVYVEQKASETE